MSKRLGPPCLVCNRLEGVPFVLPSTERQIILCKKCQSDRFQLEAAERKSKATE